MKNKAVPVAGIIFMALTTVHLIRLLCPFEISIAGWAVPIWLSGIFFVLGGLLAAWLLRMEEPPKSPSV